MKRRRRRTPIPNPIELIIWTLLIVADFLALGYC